MTKKTKVPHIEDSDCIEAMDHVYAYLNGELNDPSLHAMVEHHLSHCLSCYSRAEMEKELNERMKNTKKDKAPEELENRLKNLMDNL